MKKHFTVSIETPTNGVKLVTGAHGLRVEAESTQSAQDAARKVTEFVNRLRREL